MSDETLTERLRRMDAYIQGQERKYETGTCARAADRIERLEAMLDEATTDHAHTLGGLSDIRAERDAEAALADQLGEALTAWFNASDIAGPDSFDEWNAASDIAELLVDPALAAWRTRKENRTNG